MNQVRIPGYRIVGRLGKGGMGSVFSGIQVASGRLVAIKVLPPSSATNPDLVLRFEREAKMLASLTHPNVVQIVDRGQVGNINYFVMEYIPGRTLKDRMDQEQVSLRDVVDVVTRVGEAIQHCHDHGLVHRDLKPGNVLLTPSSEVKVTDFGISGLLRRMGDITEQGVLIGTPQYVAPEQLRDGSRVDHRADQFSLAVLAYEMLTNSLPIGVFDPVSRRRPEVPARVDSVLSRALARDPADRYRSVREFIHDFRRAFQPALPSSSATNGEGSVSLASGPETPPATQAGEGAAVAGEKEGPSGEWEARSSEDSTGTAGKAVGAGFPGGTESRRNSYSRQGPTGAEAATESGGQIDAVGFPGTVPVPRGPRRLGEGDWDPSLGGSLGSGGEGGASSRPHSGWWSRMAAPHRFGLLGLVCLLVMGAGAVALRGIVPGGTNKGPLLAGGAAAPPPLASSLAKAADVEKAMGWNACSAFLVCPRLPSGEWVVLPNLFANWYEKGGTSEMPVWLVPDRVGTQLTRGWNWEVGTGLVFTVRPSREEPRLFLALAKPTDADVVIKASHDLWRARASNTMEPPEIAPDSKNLLHNGDFSSPIGRSSTGAGWRFHRGTSPPSAPTPAPDSDRVTKENGTESFVILDTEGVVLGISQDVELEPGVDYRLQISACAPKAPNGWVTIDLAEGADTGEDETLTTSRKESTLWALSLELSPDWRRYEIRWEAPMTEDNRPCTWTWTIRARDGAARVREVHLVRSEDGE